MSSNLSKAFAKQAARIAYASSCVGRTSKRGPVPVATEERRGHTVSSRLNDAELADLDRQRRESRMQRGEYLRTSWLGAKSSSEIPENNRAAYVALARANGNLTQISRHAASINDLVGRLARLQRYVTNFRISLLEGRKSKDVVQQEDRRIGETSAQADRVSRRGPFSLPEGEARQNVVSVRLNVGEVDELDRQRHSGGGRKRGEWMRMAWQDVLPEVHIPELTERSWSALEACNSNINQVARYLNEGNDIKGRVELIEAEIEAFRLALVRAQETKQ